MKNIKIIALLCMILSGCKYTEKVASKQVARAAGTYPAIMAGYCASMYPVKESIRDSFVYIPGKQIEIPGQTVYVNCDSVVKESSSQSTKVAIKCPPVFCPSADTLKYYRSSVQESQAALKQSQSLLEEKTIAFQEQKTKNDDLSHSNTILRWWLFGLVAYVLGKLLLRVFVPAVAPFIKMLP